MIPSGWCYLRADELPRDVTLAAATAALLVMPGVTDAVPGYETLYVEFDPAVTDVATLRAALTGPLPAPARDEGRLVTIPTSYGGEHGPDLAAVAAATGASEAEVMALHGAAEYRVEAMGFLPGFAFLSGVDERLRVPRKREPRAYVPAHSVAIANHQAGVYPLASPGGWNLLGRALTALYDPHRPEPFLLRHGDTVRFVAATGEPPPSPAALSLLPGAPDLPALAVHAPGLLDLVVDAGRFRVGRLGMARSGAVDAATARLANSLLGNAVGAPLLELTLTGPTLEALRHLTVAVTGDALVAVVDGEPQALWSSFALRRGAVLTFAPGARGSRSYLAVAGGIASATFLGSASVDLRGLVGAPLTAGDVLGVAQARSAPAGRQFRPYADPRRPVRVRLLPGPQASAEALAALTAAPYTLGRSDRTAAAFEGDAVPGGEVVSEGTPLGAVQVTSGGQPLVLLHDRGSLGGYSKPAVVHPADLRRVAQLRPNEIVRFVLSRDDRTAASSSSHRDRRRAR